MMHHHHNHHYWRRCFLQLLRTPQKTPQPPQQIRSFFATATTTPLSSLSSLSSCLIRAEDVVRINSGVGGGNLFFPNNFNFNHHPFSTSTKPASSNDDEQESFPSNLYIDRRSTYAPKRVSKTEAAALTREEEDEEEEEEEDDNDKKEDDDGRVAKQEDDVNEVGEEEEEEEEGDDAYDDDDEDDVEFQFEAPSGIPVIPLPERLHVPVYNFGGTTGNDADTDDADDDEGAGAEEVGTIWLNPTIFGLDPIRVDFLKRAVDYHRAKKRGRRKAHTKTISEIRGSGRKLRPQKGQGMARVGHKKVGIRRGGAKAHGPTNQTHYGRTKLNKKVRRKAIQHVLAAKLKQGDLIIMNQFSNLPSHKTKVLVDWLQPFGIAGRHGTTALLIDHYWPDDEDDDDNDDDEEQVASTFHGVPVNLHVASGNLHQVKVGNQLRNLNVYDALKHEKLVLTLDALTAIEERLKD